MKKIVSLFLSTILINTFLFSQDGHLCASNKIHHHQQLKSNTLNSHDIALTENYDVKFYKLDVNIERTSTDISGAVQIIASSKIANLDTILFELHPDLVIDSIHLNGTSTPFTRQNTAVIIESNIGLNNLFTLDVFYGGTPPPSADWAGMSNGTSQSWGNQITWSLSEPFTAYHWFPCKQSLTDKADSVFVYITTDTSNLAGSNGLLKNIVDLGNGKHRFEWESHYPIDYYLISIAVGKYVDYTIYSNPVGASQPIPVQNYIYDNPNTLPYFQSKIDITANFIEYFSDLYGLYPFENEKYGHCMVPISGGMEHQTMTSQGFFSDGLTVHELGHQWFGDNVTCASWADIWLNEGFASYTEHLMEEHFYPGNEVQSMQDRHTNIMSQPDGSVFVLDSLNDSRIFSSRLSYDKGAAIIHTLRFLINDDSTFFDILKTYQSTFTDSTAYTSQFKSIAETLSGLNLTNFFNEWYYGEGYPTYSLEWTQDQGQVYFNLTQTTSMSSITPLFTNDLEINFSNGVADTTLRVSVSANSQSYSFPFTPSVSVVTVDPNNWIINNVGSIVQNPNLVNIIQHEMENLSVYPTNASTELTINNPNAKTAITIYDTEGKMIKRMMLNQGLNHVNIAEFANGSYIISYGKNLSEKFNVIH